GPTPAHDEHPPTPADEPADGGDDVAAGGAQGTTARSSHTITYDVQGSVPTLRDPVQARERAGDRRTAGATDAITSAAGEAGDGHRDDDGGQTTAVRAGASNGASNGVAHDEDADGRGGHDELPSLILPIVDATPVADSRHDS